MDDRKAEFGLYRWNDLFRSFERRGYRTIDLSGGSMNAPFFCG